MIIVQESWSPNRPHSALIALIHAAIHGQDAPHFVLLPLAEDDAPLAETDLAQTLSQAARGTGVHLAGAALAKLADGDVARLGFLFGPDGAKLLRSRKISPDLIEGFSDTSAALDRPATWDVAKTPFGQVAMLIGEDVLFTHYVRAAMLSGAEIIVNPAREAGDNHFRIRQQTRAARAYENHALIVTASPPTVKRGDFTERLPVASGVYDEWAVGTSAQGNESFLRVDLDIEALRRRRMEYFGNLCITMRPTVYASGYKAAAERRVNRPLPATREGWREEAAARAAAQAQCNAPSTPTIDRYDVLLGQVTPKTIKSLDHKDAVIDWNVDHALKIVSMPAMNPAVKLIAYPEFFLQGSQGARGLKAQIGMKLDSKPIEKLQSFAQKANTFIAGAILENDDAWPGFLFNTAFIIDDGGNLIHRYRKIQCADVFGFPDTTPGSILDRYLDMYGYEGLFPVARTKIGNLATAICFDMNFPELHRALAKRGAELLIHPTAEPHNIRRRPWENSRQVRAFENCMYVLSAGQGGEYWDADDPVPTFFGRGHSKVVNPDGSVQSVADGPGALWLAGQIDLKELRDARLNARSNLLLWDEPLVYADLYGARVSIPDNLGNDPNVQPYLGGKVLNEVIARFVEQGIFVAPGDTRMTEGNLATGGM
jgi:predicted amidohydrolase